MTLQRLDGNDNNNCAKALGHLHLCVLKMLKSKSNYMAFNLNIFLTVCTL